MHVHPLPEEEVPLRNVQKRGKSSAQIGRYTKNAQCSAPVVHTAKFYPFPFLLSSFFITERSPKLGGQIKHNGKTVKI